MDSEDSLILREDPAVRARKVVARSEVARKAAAFLRDHRIEVVVIPGSRSVCGSLREVPSEMAPLEMPAQIALMVHAPGGRMGWQGALAIRRR